LDEKNCLRKLLSELWENLPLLLASDIFFCLFCVPSTILFFSDLILPAIWLSGFTIIPAFSGLVYLTGRIASSKEFSIKDIIVGIYHFYRRSIILGSIIALLLSFILCTLGLINANPAQGWLIFPLSIQFSALLFIALLLAYIFSLMTIYDISLQKAFIYAFLLASNYKMPTIGTFSLIILFVFLIRWTKFGLILVCPALWAIFVTNITLLLVQKQLSY